jgi:hypothetical protein
LTQIQELAAILEWLEEGKKNGNTRIFLRLICVGLFDLRHPQSLH